MRLVATSEPGRARTGFGWDSGRLSHYFVDKPEAIHRWIPHVRLMTECAIGQGSSVAAAAEIPVVQDVAINVSDESVNLIN